MYSIKPFPKISQGAKNGERKREEEKKKIADKAKLHAETRLEDKEESMKMASEVISSIDNNTETINQALASLKVQIEKIDIEVPEFDTSEIIKAIEASTQNLNESLAGINQQVSNIKIDIPEVDMDAYTKKITAEMKKNTTSLTRALESLGDKISNIQLETNEPITQWNFKVTRDNDQNMIIDAKANTERTLN